MSAASSYADDSLIRILFTIDLVVLFLLLAGIVWSVIRPDRRIWPPPGRPHRLEEFLGPQGRLRRLRPLPHAARQT